MPRSIKYRAWDTQNSNSDLTRIKAKMLGWDTVRHMVMNTVEDGKAGRYTFMQYTGVKDMNGVEICEGDIVRRHHDLLVIVWDEDVAGFGWINQLMHEYTMFRKYSAEHLEVIGNIYENPELLPVGGLPCK